MLGHDAVGCDLALWDLAEQAQDALLVRCLGRLGDALELRLHVGGDGDGGDVLGPARVAVFAAAGLRSHYSREFGGVCECGCL